MKLDASDPRYHQAIAEIKAELGVSIPDVLLPTQWFVHMRDGHPFVCLNEDGMRALALVAPRPDACQVVEDIIKSNRERFGRSTS